MTRSTRLKQVLFNNNEAHMGSRAVAASRRLGVLALTVAVGVAVASAASAQPPPAKATGLSPGQAKGTLTVNAKPVTLGYAYAGLEPDAFDKNTDDIVILLTDTPIPDEIFAGKPVSSAARAPGVKNYLMFVFREDKQQAGAFGFLGKWIVGRRIIGHDALKGKTLQSSPDMDVKVEPVAVEKDRVEATLSTEGPQDNFGDKFEYRVAFNAVVKPRAK
jgi:hypothetical protein